ncbi:MAG: glycosyltransferase family 2 protein [Candidatus Eisenbacteria bacterium]
MGDVRLSALVITRDEEAGIARCLAALSFCDEIVLVDAESTDRTVEIARGYTDRIWVEPWRGYSEQKSFALEKCRGDWVLWIDADEVVSAPLRDEILQVTRKSETSPERAKSGADSTVHAYELARRVYYLGGWIRHGGWGEDRVVRLFRRGRAEFSGDRVHERLLVDGTVAPLAGVLEHYTYRDIGHHWEKIRKLASLGAEQAYERGRRWAPGDWFFRPLARGLKIYVWKRGFLDGWRGAMIAGMGMAYVFLKYAMLKEKEERER